MMPPNLSMGLGNLEITQEDSMPTRPTVSLSTLRSSSVEIPERRRAPAVDSDSSANEGDKDEFKYLANPKKYNPLAAKVDDKSDNSSSREKVEKDTPNDAASENSHISRFSRKSGGAGNLPFANLFKNKNLNDAGSSNSANAAAALNRDNDYKERYSAFGPQFDDIKSASAAAASSAATIPDFQQPQPLFSSRASNPLSSTFFQRKSDQDLTEDEIRRLKSEFLERYEKINRKRKYSPKILSMRNDLGEIRNELEYVTTRHKNGQLSTMWKHGISAVVTGIASLNDDWFKDPYELELSEWAENVTHDVHNSGNYEDVLDELIEKWHQGKLPISPEMKLLMMLGGSAFINIRNKKQQQAKLKKRLREERLMEEKMNRMFDERIRNMQQQPAAPSTTQGGGYQNGAGNHPLHSQVPPPSGFQGIPVMQPTHPYHDQNSIPKMKGPSLSKEDLMKKLNEQFIDSDILGDDSISLQTDNSVRSEKSARSNVSKNSINDNAGVKLSEKLEEDVLDEASEQELSQLHDTDIPMPVKRKVGRPRKEEPPVSKTISLPVKKRGRPRKNPLPIGDANEITLEL